jgi:hypothetical protein
VERLPLQNGMDGIIAGEVDRSVEMTYRGRVKEGVNSLDKPGELPEGVVVRVEIDPTPEEMARLREDLRRVAGSAPGLPQDMARKHDHYIHGKHRE